MFKNQYNLLLMFIMLAILLGSIYLVFADLLAFFIANHIINSIILGVLSIGLLYAFHSVFMLRSEKFWLDSVVNTDSDLMDDKRIRYSRIKPRLLIMLAHFSSIDPERRGRQLSLLSTDIVSAILHSVDSRLNESRETLRYCVGLLVFLGLLGTFWGLLDTLASISQVVGNLNPIGDGDNVFSNLRQSLTGPLAGMGTAFSSSLFGLGGSLVLGFFALQVSQSQNRFYNELEILLNRIMRYSSSDDTPQNFGVYGQSLVENSAENINKLSASLKILLQTLQNDNADHKQSLMILHNLQKIMIAHSENVERLMISQSETSEQLIARHIQSEQGLQQALPTQRQNSQNIELLENISQGLERLQANTHSQASENTQSICNEIRILTRTIANSYQKDTPSKNSKT